jgi:hypothetical protein
MFELGEDRYLQASFEAVNWVLNLRAAGDVRTSKGRWSEDFTAIELAVEGLPEERDQLLRAAAVFDVAGQIPSEQVARLRVAVAARVPDSLRPQAEHNA